MFAIFYNFYSHDEVADDCHAGSVAREHLIDNLCLVILRLEVLVVKVQVVRLPGHELASILQCLDEQAVQHRFSIEILVTSLLRGLGRVGGGQFRITPEDGIGAAGAQGGIKRQVGH